MTKVLKVYLHQNYVGQLFFEDGQMYFQYAEEWINNADAYPLSHSLPLSNTRYEQKICHSYFAGILPEENNRRIIAKNLGISANNDFALLEQIGGECAGAVTLVASSETIHTRLQNYRELSNKELQDILKILPKQPLLAGDDGVRLSLAGAQDKIAVRYSNNIISIPLGGAPSTHILKPAIPRFEGIVFNEAYCLKLAEVIGLPVAKAQIMKTGNNDYLLVGRYDRYHDENNNVMRLHQEDFCQALGIASEQKYQSEGGPSFKDCFNLLKEASTRPALDILRLLDAIIFNFLIGNHDAHGKNFSLLYQSGNTKLAPLYDLVCTAYYPKLSKNMAMSIGKETDSSKIKLDDFRTLAEDSGLSYTLMIKRLFELTNEVLQSINKVEMNHPTVNKVKNIIERRCKLFLAKIK